MPLQNRVQPTGEIIAHPARGMFTGNRGIIHRPDGTLGTSRWSHKHWLICTLTHPRGIYHGPMPARRWTALFFLDEAVALSAGHRPCHYCRRAAYQAFQRAWETGTNTEAARLTIDTMLHQTRVARTRQQIRHSAPVESLPDHAFCLHQGRAHLALGANLHPYEPGGYGPAVDPPNGDVTVLTPRPMLDVLRGGYVPALHPSAARPAFP